MPSRLGMRHRQGAPVAAPTPRPTSSLTLADGHFPKRLRSPRMLSASPPSPFVLVSAHCQQRSMRGAGPLPTCGGIIGKHSAERDALAQIKCHIDEVRNGTGWTVQIDGVLLQQCDQYGKTIDTRRADKAEAERDALRETVGRVQALVDSNPDHADTCGSVLTPGADYPCSCWQTDLRAALATTGEGQ